MRRLSSAIAVLVGLTACQDMPLDPQASPETRLAEQSASRVVASATGSGHRARNDRALVFSFQALHREDGTSEGKYYLDWQDLGPALDHQRLQVEVDVTCMSVQDNIAWVAGIITKVDGPIAQEGTVSYFYVIDHGEGVATVDEISGLRLNDVAGEDELFCDEQPLLLVKTAIERGNAQVRSH
jgi:hypothetical protein